MPEIEVIQLPRGGTLIKTPSGVLQVGATPETIKDTLHLMGEVPDTFVLPNRLFSTERGVSLADIEFPVYYNYFLKQRSIKVIGQSHQLETILGVLKEAILGPDTISLQREYPYGVNRELIPDLRAEMEFFRAKDSSGLRKMEMSDIAIGIPWGPNNRVPFGNLALERTPKGMLRVVDGARVLAEVPLDVTFGSNREFPERKKPFSPPLFGITVIGSGHGFDPKEMTSGFIVWVNRRGILVDPPVDSTHWLKSMDINPRLIEDCILTHCHADHDSGILQKILEEKKINLYTTESIMESCVRKYRALTGLSYKTFMGLFHFHPVTLQVPMHIHGGEFRFFYTLHSIPTIGFEIYYQGKSFVYSSDSLYDPPTVRKLFDMGVINRYRMIELMNFPWHHTVIFHEAGIPPIHTPIKNLAGLPESVQQRLYLIHVSERSIPPGSKLRKTPAGPDDTIVIPVIPPVSNEALEYLDVLSHIDLFSELPIEKAREFLTLVKVETFKAGDVIIRNGTVGDRFFMVVNGRAQVRCDNGIMKTYSNNDYIGETSMILNAPRNADVVAETDLKVLVMDKYDFLYFIRGSEIALHMKVIAENREFNTWTLFDNTPLLHGLSATQRTQLQGIMARFELADGKILAKEGAEREAFYLLESGVVSMSRCGRKVAKAQRGSLFMRIYATPSRGRHRFTLAAEGPVVVYSIDTMEFYRFLERNPGVFLLLREAKIRTQIVSADRNSRP
ncbi:MAG TPA: cAMP/cGMP-dependent 3',5'-cyclic-AMP/GMP phosphodiesterase [Candidatus Ozemobacteraceae bacterium]|nr:cAMP/cGMP-dependent 3',5'-cyclic-AMP/GMP phosphodiesterase [Candidatus Ozemobacteraceae bacterium]